MKSTILQTAIGLLALGLTALPSACCAEATDKPSNHKTAAESSEKAETKKSRSLPFHGTIIAVDKSAKTLSVGKRVFQVTSETKVFKGPEKAPATLADAAVGERITGSYQQAAGGKLTARSIYLGGKTESGAGKKAGGGGEKKS